MCLMNEENGERGIRDTHATGIRTLQIGLYGPLLLSCMEITGLKACHERPLVQTDWKGGDSLPLKEPKSTVL